MKRALRTILAVVCILLITVCSVLMIQKLVGGARADLTQRKLYTLSEGTRNVLAGLGQPVTLKLYYSRIAAMKGPEDIRYYNNYFLYVRDLLEEYVHLSEGKLKLLIIDPRPDSDEEEAAIRYGVKKFPLSDDENFFFGLAAVTELGKEDSIPFFEPQRQEFVEYDISKLISGVTRRAKKKLGILSSLPVMGSDTSPYMMQMMQMQGRQPEKPWAIVDRLREEYTVVAVADGADSVEEDVDFLMVVHPKNLAENTLLAIDQYVMRGGKLVVFVDPHCLSDRPPRDPNNPYAAMEAKASSDLNRLLRGWGIETEPDLIAADRALALKARLRRDGPVEPVPIALTLTDKSVNPEEVIAADLHTIRTLFAGVLRPVGGSESTVTSLLFTTDTGGTWKPESPFDLQMPDPAAINKAIVETGAPVMLACRINGPLKTNFPDGLFKDDKKVQPEAGKDETAKAAEETPGDEKKPETIKKSSPEAAVLVFADVDMISDVVAFTESFFGLAEVGDNASLLLNALDFLSGTGDLISIRSRGRYSRPFAVVDAIEAQAEKETAAEVEAVKAKITEYREGLNKFGAEESKDDVKLVEKNALAERQKLEESIREAQKELRRLSAGKREKIESLKASLQTHNMVWAPAVVLLIAIGLALVRLIKAKRYAARRMQ